MTTQDIIDSYKRYFKLTDKELIYLLASDLRSIMLELESEQIKSANLFNATLSLSSKIYKMKVKLNEINSGGLVTDEDFKNLPNKL